MTTFGPAVPKRQCRLCKGQLSKPSSLLNFKRTPFECAALRQSEFTTAIGPCHLPRVHIWTSSSSAPMTAGADVSRKRERAREATKRAQSKKKKKNLSQTHALSQTPIYSCTYTGKINGDKMKTTNQNSSISVLKNKKKRKNVVRRKT